MCCSYYSSKFYWIETMDLKDGNEECEEFYEGSECFENGICTDILICVVRSVLAKNLDSIIEPDW